MLKKTIKIGNLFKALGISPTRYYDTQYTDEQVYVNSPSGYIPIRGYVIKNDVDTVRANVNGMKITGADKHLVKIDGVWFSLDSFEHESIGKHDLYDIAVDEPHEYFTSNGIINHNTSISKALCQEIGADYLYINASSENGIDTVREDITRFASNKSFNNCKKAIILDEADMLSFAAQKALLSHIERFQNVCRFIFTCNYVNKIIPAARSRLMEYDFNMNTKQIRDEMIPKVSKRLSMVLKFEKIDHKEETIRQLVENLYPDIRKMYQLLQQYSKVNGIIDDNIFNAETVDELFYDMVLSKKLTAARQFMLDSGYNYEDMYSNIYRELIPRVESKQTQAEMIVVVAEWAHKSNLCTDKELAFSAMLVELMRIL